MIWLDRLAVRYGRLPSEMMAMDPGDYLFNQYVAYRAMKEEARRGK